MGLLVSAVVVKQWSPAQSIGGVAVNEAEIVGGENVERAVGANLIVGANGQSRGRNIERLIHIRSGVPIGITRLGSANRNRTDAGDGDRAAGTVAGPDWMLKLTARPDEAVAATANGHRRRSYWRGPEGNVWSPLLTVMEALVLAVIPAWVLSLAVTVRLPALIRVMENVWLPALNAASDGNMALASLEVMCTESLVLIEFQLRGLSEQYS